MVHEKSDSSSRTPIAIGREPPLIQTSLRSSHRSHLLFMQDQSQTQKMKRNLQMMAKMQPTLASADRWERQDMR